MALVTGARDTKNIETTRIIRDVGDTILQLQPDKTPLLVLLNRIAKKPTISYKFEDYEDDLMATWTAINNANGYDENATSIVVDDGSVFAPNDILQVPRAKECMLVTAVSSNTLTVKRGFGETDAAALNDNDPVQNIGNAFEEGASAPAAKTTKKAAYYNFTQIFRTPVEHTGTLMAMRLYGGNVDYERAKAAVEHLVKIERAFWFGERKEDTSGTHPRRTTRGVLKHLTTNETDCGGNNFSESTYWLPFLEKVFQYGSDTKFLFASGALITELDKIAAGRLNLLRRDEGYGLTIREWETTHGRLFIIKNKLFTGAIYGKFGVVLDIDNPQKLVRYRYLEGRDTALRIGIQAKADDTQKDEYLTECGCQVMLEKCHGWIHNFA